MRVADLDAGENPHPSGVFSLQTERVGYRSQTALVAVELGVAVDVAVVGDV